MRLSTPSSLGSPWRGCDIGPAYAGQEKIHFPSDPLKMSLYLDFCSITGPLASAELNSVTGTESHRWRIVRHHQTPTPGARTETSNPIQ